MLDRRYDDPKPTNKEVKKQIINNMKLFKVGINAFEHWLQNIATSEYLAPNDSFPPVGCHNDLFIKEVIGTLLLQDGHLAISFSFSPIIPLPLQKGK